MTDLLQKEELVKYPGGEIIAKGLDDIQEKKETIESLVLLTATKRLNELGFKISAIAQDPHLLLYKKLSERYGNEAHYKYNALLKRFSKFLQHFALKQE